MKRLLIIILSVSLFTPGRAQTSMEEILRSIETNNKDLQANRQLTVSKKLEAKLDNNLADPSVSYSHQYGNKEGMGMQGELVASQSFDFPSLYVQRNKLAKAMGTSFERQGDEFRQQILLQAKELCLDLVFLNQQKNLLEQRLRNAEQLASLYKMRLDNGDANILETNKIDLELLNTKNEARMNESARVAKLQELAALNGGIAIDFTDTAYTRTETLLSFEDLKQEAIPANRQLLALQSEKTVALRQVSVSKSQGLPGFEVGYRLNTATGGDRFNGFVVGVNIPLFSNRNNVKQAKAQTLYTDMQLESATITVENELFRLYNQALTLCTSIEEYQKVLKSQNSVALLNKAIQAGQISMIEYFVDITTLYQSIQNYMQLQNEYQKVLAQMYKFRL